MDDWAQGSWFDPTADQQPDQGANEPPAPDHLGHESDEVSGWPAGGAGSPSAAAGAWEEETGPWGAPTGGFEATGEDEPWSDDADTPATSDGWRAPASGRGRRPVRRSHPLFQPAPEPDDPYAAPQSQVTLGAGVGGAALAGGVVQSFSGSAVAGQQAARDRANQRRGRRAGALLFLISLLAALMICSCAWLLFNSGLFAPGFSFAPGQRDATETPSVASTATGNGHSATPTRTAGTATPSASATSAPTPTPDPNRTTIAFLVDSKQITSPGGMTACASGCNIPWQAYSNQQTFSVTNVQSSGRTVEGDIQVTNSSPTTGWNPGSFQFASPDNAYKCEPQQVFVSAGTTKTFHCVLDITSPSSLPAGTINGSITIAGGKVTYKNPDVMLTVWTVTGGDCDSATSNTQDQGRTWGTNWVKSQPPSGWLLPTNSLAPHFSWSNGVCPVGEHLQYFDASSLTHVSDAAINPADARTLASTRLNGQVPAGYTLKPGSATTCTPTGIKLNTDTGDEYGNVTNITLTCSDSGLAIRTWTSSMKDQLAASVAGKSKSQALDICNHTSGVKPGSCVITISGGSATLPSSTSLITVQANSP